MSDLISRQQAIDAIKTWGLIDGLSEGQAIEILADEEKLPSAQPKIVQCKDCKYWMPHSQLGYDEDNETYHDYCEKLIPEDEYYAFYRDADDYCSRAERRTDG